MTTKNAKVIMAAMIAIATITAIVFYNADHIDATTTQDAKAENLQKLIEIGQTYEKIHGQLQKTTDAATREKLNEQLQSLIAQANQLGVPTRKQQVEDPNAWPMEIFIPN